MLLTKQGILVPTGLAPTNAQGLFIPHHYCAYCMIVRDMPLSEQLLKCARCHASHYDSRNCQKKHWKQHKKLCGRPPDTIKGDVSRCQVLYREEKEEKE